MEKDYQHKWLILANVAVGIFMATLDGSIVNVALPTIASEFKVDLPVLQWVVTAYLLTISSLLPIWGRLADMIGRKLIFSVSFIIFGLGSILCGLASNVHFLIFTRVIQAVGASMLMANSMAIVTEAFPPQERGRALGINGTIVALGSLTGPSVGGFLVSAYGWPSIFLVNIPISLIGFLSSRIIIPNKRPSGKKEPFDLAGAALFAVGMVLLLWALSEGKDLGWNSQVIVISLLVSVILLISFFSFEKRNPYPMIDLNLFKNPIFFYGNLAGFISFVAMFATNILMPFYMERVLHFSPYEIGLMMTPFPAAMAIVAPISGWLSDRIGPPLLTTGGLTINVLGLISISYLSVDAGYVDIAFRMLILGTGMGLFQSPNNSSIMGSVSPNKLGVAGGIVPLVRNVGMVMGIAFSVSLFTWVLGLNLPPNAGFGTAQYAKAFLKAMSLTFRAAAVICVFGVLASAVRGKKYRALDHQIELDPN